jgi:hypothetical protein
MLAVSGVVILHYSSKAYIIEQLVPDSTKPPQF